MWYTGTLKEVQSVLGLPELKIVKPSSTRWLSHERCMKAIRKELPALILTLQDLSEAFGIQKILSSFGGVAAVILLGEILNLLASFNCFMQKKTADFSRLKIMLNSTLDQIKSLKADDASWCSEVDEVISSLQDEHDIVVGTNIGTSRNALAFSNLKSFRDSVALPYIDTLVQNIENRFSEEGVQLLMAASIFNPAQLPDKSDPGFNQFGNKEIRRLANFYGREVEVDFKEAHSILPLFLKLISSFQSGLYSVGPYKKRKKH